MTPEPPIPRQRFGPRQRLGRRGDFERVYARRCRASDDSLAVHAAANGLAWSRLGISVGKRIGNAAVRNHAKRRLREAFRRHKEQIPQGFDLVCVVRKNLRSLDVERSLIGLGTRAAEYARRAAAKSDHGPIVST